MGSAAGAGAVAGCGARRASMRFGPFDGAADAGFAGCSTFALLSGSGVCAGAESHPRAPQRQAAARNPNPKLQMDLWVMVGTGYDDFRLKEPSGN